MDIQKLLDEGFRVDWFEKTPVGLYLVSHDGVLLRCNQRALKLFRVSADDVAAGRVNLADFYKDRSEREQLQRRDREAADNGQRLDRQRVLFCIGGEDVFVEINSESIRDEAGTIAGYIDYVLDVTKETRYYQLLDSLTEGVYQADASGTIVLVNTAVARQFGYTTPDEMVGLSLSSLFSDPNDAKALRYGSDHEAVPDVAWRMTRRDGSQFFASITGLTLQSSDGRYQGLEGTIRDVTRSEQYKELISKLPLGFYMLERRDGDDYVQNCNFAFARLFGYDSENQVIGRRMRDLHADASKYDQFTARLEEADRAGAGGFSEEPFRIKTHDGRSPYVQVTCTLLRNHEGTVIGRVGVIRDVTEEEPLRQQVKELTADIGNMLHSYSATLHTMVTSIRPGMDTILRNPGEHIVPGKEPVLEQVKREAHSLGQLVSTFLVGRANDEHTIAMLGPEHWAWLQGLHDRLDGVASSVSHPEMAIPAFYDLAVEVHDLFYARRGRLERHSLRVIMNQAWLVERLCAHAGLLRARDAAITMDYSTRALREFIIRSERPEEPMAVHRVADLIESAIHNVADFAREKGIIIDRRGISRTTRVRVVEREMVRALANLLHNAIKYSWSREGKPPWVEVRTAREQPPSGRSGVRIEFENYGVPIPGDEIGKGLIYRFGFRGRLAAERRRTGTGVGLTDAKQVMERHGGELTISSRVARAGAAEDDYGQPFITTATAFLPVSDW
jgi:PAS domain S-box-containing protein